MHESYWKLTESPFHSRSLRYFYNSPTHDEALARLHFLGEERRTLGILTGGEGCGKSRTLAAFRDQWWRTGHPVVSQDVLAVDDREFLWNLAAALGANPRSDADHFTLWRRINDQLAANHYQELHTVILLDDADQASPQAMVQIQRLVRTQCGRVSVILAFDDSQGEAITRDLRQLSELRIQLEMWTEDVVREYLECVLAEAGQDEPIFDDLAVERLSQLSGGVPRWIAQLAELALIAGAGQRLDRIGAETIEIVYDEVTAPYEQREIPETA